MPNVTGWKTSSEPWIWETRVGCGAGKGSPLICSRSRGASIPRASGDWAGAKGARNRQPAGQKESRKWLQSAPASAPAATAPWSVVILRRPGQKATTATLAIRCTQVRFAPPAHQAKYRGQT